MFTVEKGHTVIRNPYIIPTIISANAKAVITAFFRYEATSLSLPLPKDSLTRGCVPCAIPLKIAAPTRARLAIRP